MRIPPETISKLNSDQKKWLGRAIAGIVVVDGIVDKSEVDYIREAIGFLENGDEINDLVGQVKKRVCPPLGHLAIKHGLAARLLMNLAEIAIVDEKLTQKEAEYLKDLGAKMNVEGKFAQQVVKWAHSLLEINKLKKELLRKADNPLLG